MEWAEHSGAPNNQVVLPEGEYDVHLAIVCDVFAVGDLGPESIDPLVGSGIGKRHGAKCVGLGFVGWGVLPRKGYL